MVVLGLGSWIGFLGLGFSVDGVLGLWAFWNIWGWGYLHKHRIITLGKKLCVSDKLVWVPKPFCVGGASDQPTNQIFLGVVGCPKKFWPLKLVTVWCSSLPNYLLLSQISTLCSQFVAFQAVWLRPIIIEVLPEKSQILKRPQFSNWVSCNIHVHVGWVFSVFPRDFQESECRW